MKYLLFLIVICIALSCLTKLKAQSVFYYDSIPVYNYNVSKSFLKSYYLYENKDSCYIRIIEKEIFTNQKLVDIFTFIKNKFKIYKITLYFVESKNISSLLCVDFHFFDKETNKYRCLNRYIYGREVYYEMTIDPIILNSDAVSFTKSISKQKLMENIMNLRSKSIFLTPYQKPIPIPDAEISDSLRKEATQDVMNRAKQKK